MIRPVPPSPSRTIRTPHGAIGIPALASAAATVLSRAACGSLWGAVVVATVASDIAISVIVGFHGLLWLWFRPGTAGAHQAGLRHRSAGPGTATLGGPGERLRRACTPGRAVANSDHPAERCRGFPRPPAFGARLFCAFPGAAAYRAALQSRTAAALGWLLRFKDLSGLPADFSASAATPTDLWPTLGSAAPGLVWLCACRPLRLHSLLPGSLLPTWKIIEWIRLSCNRFIAKMEHIKVLMV